MRAVGNRWFWLVASVAGWTAAGLVMFADGSGAPPHGTENAAAVEAPRRIVAMAPSLTEILFALGLGDRIAGVTTDSNYPPAAKDKAVIGSFWQPDIEAVVTARPDMVVTEEFDQQMHLAQRLRRLGYRTVSVDIWTVAQLYDAIERIGTVTGRRKDADALLERIRGNIARISNRTTEGTRPKVLYVIQTEPLRVAGRETFINEFIELAGGVNAIGPTVQKYPPIGSEAVIASAADVIIAPAMAGVRRAELEKCFARYESVPAVANRRIYVIEGDTVSRLGPRIDEAVETIARCIRPEQ